MVKTETATDVIQKQWILLTARLKIYTIMRNGVNACSVYVMVDIRHHVVLYYVLNNLENFQVFCLDVHMLYFPFIKESIFRISYQKRSSWISRFSFDKFYCFYYVYFITFITFSSSNSRILWMLPPGTDLEKLPISFDSEMKDFIDRFLHIWGLSRT